MRRRRRRRRTTAAAGGCARRAGEGRARARRPTSSARLRRGRGFVPAGYLPPRGALRASEVVASRGGRVRPAFGGGCPATDAWASTSRAGAGAGRTAVPRGEPEGAGAARVPDGVWTRSPRARPPSRASAAVSPLARGRSPTARGRSPMGAERRRTKRPRDGLHPRSSGARAAAFFRPPAAVRPAAPLRLLCRCPRGRRREVRGEPPHGPTGANALTRALPRRARPEAAHDDLTCDLMGAPRISPFANVFDSQHWRDVRGRDGGGAPAVTSPGRTATRTSRIDMRGPRRPVARSFRRAVLPSVPALALELEPRHAARVLNRVHVQQAASRLLQHARGRAHAPRRRRSRSRVCRWTTRTRPRDALDRPSVAARARRRGRLTRADARAFDVKTGDARDVWGHRSESVSNEVHGRSDAFFARVGARWGNPARGDVNLARLRGCLAARANDSPRRRTLGHPREHRGDVHRPPALDVQAKHLGHVVETIGWMFEMAGKR